jgi:ribosomal protein S12 methylthiotransferase accessory factor
VEAFGITRLADLTDLDVIGLPNFQAVRPMARSVSVSQGKGSTRTAARVSALMEAMELHHAETIIPSTHGTCTPAEQAFWEAIPPSFQREQRFDPHRPRGWCAGTDLLTGHAIRVPHALVSMDFAAPLEPDLRGSSNGLASGNTFAEATVSALCEVIERDAHARWLALSPGARRDTAIAVDSIADRLLRALIDHIIRAGFSLRLWDMSDGHGVAVAGCVIFEMESGRATVLPPAFGAGAHSSARVALARAITEAAQTRVTLIAGSRDDIEPSDYVDPAGRRLALLLETGMEQRGQRHWRDMPDMTWPDLDEDRAWLIERCRALGVPAVACVDLTNPECGLAVAKIVVPGFGDQSRVRAAWLAA